MSDTSQREIERKVDEEPSNRNFRFQLTRDRVRSAQGLVAWWPGQVKPHDSASRLTLSYETVNPVTRERHTARSPGWVVAVAGVQDLFDFAKVARSCTVLDLGTGDWLHTHGRRSATDLGVLSLQEEITTVDAFGRPRSTVRATPRSFDSDRVVRRPNGDPHSVWREEPLYDIEFVPADSFSQVRLFSNSRQFSFAPPNMSNIKIWGLHTNSIGTGGLPRGWQLDVTGISILFFDQDGKPLARQSARELARDVYCQFACASSPLATWPLEAVLLEHHEDGQVIEQAPEISHPAPPVLPFAWPFVLHETEQFGVDFTAPFGFRRGPFAFFVKCILSGFACKSYAG